MATIVYLDVEDEITSAATRIRGAEESRVALVLPFGSRLATSRINFRMLAREALVNGRRLDVIAPDASARALAASAGLPVFASVGEYEDALDHPADDGGPPAGAGPAVVAVVAGAAGVEGVTGTAGATGAAAGPAGARTRRASDASPGPASRAADSGRPPGSEDASLGAPRGDLGVAQAPRRRRIGAGPLVGIAIVALAVLAAGVAGFTLLPSAEITVTPRIETIAPISLTVRADPAATAVDTDSAVIPAQTLSIPVESSGEFPATGKRVVAANATGGVRWTNCDPTLAYTIPRGTIVKTATGIGFTTDEAVFLPVAPPTGTRGQYTCQTSDVAITAVDSGPSGNVAAGAIRVMPARYNRIVVSVTNPAATTGGKRDEFPKVAQKDVDAAVVQLRKDLEAKFATALEDPGTTPEGSTLFPGTATLGDPVPSVDPATLVGQEVASFTLRMTATGAVLAVDATPVRAIAEARLQASIGSGYRLVDGSISVTVGKGTVVGGVVTFHAEGSAKRVRVLDAAALKRQVLGLGSEDARKLLAPYGDVNLALWPDWVSSVPGLDQRVTLTIATPADATPSAAPSPGASSPADASPSAAPTASAAPSSPPASALPSAPAP